MAPVKKRGTNARKKRGVAPRIARKVSAPSRERAKFVGREPSPVLDHYPPKDPGIAVRGNLPSPAAPASRPASPPAPVAASPPSTAPPPPPVSLISLERPFDVDEFSQSLGENAIRVTVPREDLAEVLRRITDFMGFGIYVYRFSVRPAPSDQLKQFIVELERVDYSPEARDWVPFEEKGRSESPFGPGSTR